MDTSEFQRDVKRTMNPDVVGPELLNNALLGIFGEAGELSDIIKKWRYQEHDMAIGEAVDELGDLLYYVTLAIDWYGFGIDEVMERNMRKRAERYPHGFEAERSINRNGA